MHLLSSLTAMCQARIYLFVSMFRQKNQTSRVLVSYKLELGICLVILNVSLEFSSDFYNTEAAFKKCSTKVVVQQNDMMKYSSSAPGIKCRKALLVNFLRMALHRWYFSKNLTTSTSFNQ